MEVIYLLIPISLIILAVIIGVFLWGVKSGQFDDLEGPAHRILMDDDDVHPENQETSGPDSSPESK